MASIKGFEAERAEGLCDAGQTCANQEKGAIFLDDRPSSDIQEPARRGALLSDDHILEKDEAELVAFLLGGQNFSYSEAGDGSLTWGAFGASYHTLGELRVLARDNVAEEPPLPVVVDAETVGIELFGNMLDTIAFLRVRLRALADVVIEKGIVSGPELLGKYHEYHERSFEAFRDIMLLRPEIFEQRFAEWLRTEQAYRRQLSPEPPAPSAEP
ncbi:MAG: hypothetical protein IAI50_07425 [Candidatus Eremiobacteraeota bacterium]|nr:hypothetical protein [Candidatus Eremiobacteraeota bacterium]